MRSWPDVEVGEVCEFKYGKSLAASVRDGGRFPVYGSNGIVGRHSSALTDGPTIVIGRKGSLGEVAYSDSPCWPIDTTYYVDSTSTDADIKWLSYGLAGLGLTDLNRAAAVPGLNREDAYRQRLLLPPMDDQRRIAAILDQARTLYAKHRQVLTHLDILTQSVFRDTFGEIGISDWQEVALGVIVSRIDNGSSPNCESRPADPTEWGVLKLGAVTYGEFRPSENKAYLGNTDSISSNEVRAGDVLMTRKNTRELVGAVALVDEVRPRLVLPDLIFRLHLDSERINRRYFHVLMMHPAMRATVRNLSSGSAASMPNISKARLRTLPLKLPPLNLQKEFAAKVEAIDHQRRTIRDTLVADEELFSSLQSRAFRGEL